MTADNANTGTVNRDDYCCFPAGTPVTMADGSFVAIEKVAEGALVLAYDVLAKRQSVSKNGHVGVFLRDNMCTLVLAGNKTVKVTEDHPLFTKEGWKALNPLKSLQAYGTEASQLQIGDFILSDSNTWIELKSWTKETGDFTTYSLMDVLPHHNFYADGLLAHNRDDSETTKTVVSQSATAAGLIILKPGDILYPIATGGARLSFSMIKAG